MNRYHRYPLTFVALILLCYIAWAHSSYTGRTLKNGSGGCGGCHASQSAAVTVAITGPDTLKTGADGTYAVKISGGSGSSVCVDIASSAGTLKTADNTLKLTSSELITNGVKKYTSGSYTYNFKLTAPTSTQTVTLYATGMSTQSTYNFAPNKTITVVSATDVKADPPAAERSFAITQSYPSPASTSAVIGYTMMQPGSVRLVIYDAAGRECAVLVDAFHDAGSHVAQWNAAPFPAGVYLCRLSAASQAGAAGSETIKLVVLR